jgi:ribosome-dependent ATPase
MSWRRLRTLMWREVVEIRRDPFRLMSAFVVPVVLLFVFGYGLSLDVLNVPYAVHDLDGTPASRAYVEGFAHIRQFNRKAPVYSDDELDRRMAAGEVKLVIELPPSFGRDLEAGRRPQAIFLVDGTMPFLADTVRGYARAIHLAWLDRRTRETAGAPPGPAPASLRVRYWYNQELQSRYAFVPGMIAAVLLISPAILTAVAVVREKEFGAITNLYATPVTPLEYLLGKQIPYALISMINVGLLAAMAVVLFGVPLKGDVLAFALGGILYTFAGTGLGLLISSFARTQVAAVVMTVILTLVPSFLYSGLLSPVATMPLATRLVAHAYPAMYFLNISVGVFTKDRPPAQLIPDFLALAAFVVVSTTLSLAFVRKQGP